MPEKVKSWFKNNIMDFSGDEKESPPINSNSSTANVTNANTSAIPQMNTMQQTIQTKPSEKFLKHFEELIKNNNLPGLDYLEFMDILNKMSANPILNLQEDQKFATAWITFSSVGATTDKNVLINTAQHYLDILNKDKETFLGIVNTEITNTVGSLQNRVKTIEERNIKAQEEIVKLQQEIANNNAEKSNLHIQITEQTTKTTSKQNEYVSTYNQIIEQIKSDIMKIQTYIK